MVSLEVFQQLSFMRIRPKMAISDLDNINRDLSDSVSRKLTVITIMP